MLYKIKNYYRNSPKRIGWTWLLVHVFFIGCITQYVGGGGVPSFFYEPMAIGFFGLALLLFPMAPLLNYQTLWWEFLPEWAVIVPQVVISVTYYTLFFVMCRKAVDTSKREFSILQAVLAVWFLVSLISSICFILSDNFV